MAKRVGVDKWLFGVTVLLVFIGLLMVFSASAVMAQDRYGSPYTFVRSQAAAAVLGLLTMIVLMRVDYRKFNRPIVVLPAVAVTGQRTDVRLLGPSRRGCGEGHTQNKSRDDFMRGHEFARQNAKSNPIKKLLLVTFWLLKLGANSPPMFPTPWDFTTEYSWCQASPARLYIIGYQR